MKYLLYCDDPDKQLDHLRADKPIVGHKVYYGINFMGLVDHDVPCMVCFDKPAIHINDPATRSHFQPCWQCQEEGWLIRRPRLLRWRWLGWLVNLLTYSAEPLRKR